MTGNIYRLKVSALCNGIDEEDIYNEINVDEIYDDYEEARHQYENWKYDTNVMDAHGHVSLVEMAADEGTHKFVVTRELGDKQW